jgi:ribosomal protein L19E
MKMDEEIKKGKEGMADMRLKEGKKEVRKDRMEGNGKRKRGTENGR